MNDERIEFINDINKFVNYLLDNNSSISYASISRAIGKSKTNNIRTGHISYKSALLIKNAYINNYREFKKITT